MKIEPARPEDVPAIGQLYEELNARMAALQPDNFRPARQSEVFILDMLGGKDSDILAARTPEGQVIGFALVQCKDTPPHPSFIPRRYTYLMDIVVAETCRGKGVGKSLLGAVEQWARERGSEFVELGVLTENLSAIQVYESFGFVERRKVMELDLTEKGT